LSKPQPSVMKRQREQAKRDRQRMKVERRAQRKDAAGKEVVEENEGVVTETPMETPAGPSAP
jgi:hypothetical protein